MEERRASTLPGVLALSRTVILDDGMEVPLHIARYDRESFHPRLVKFDEPTPIVPWARQHGISEATNAGYNTFGGAKPLGDIWIGGQHLPHEPWAGKHGPGRGAIQIDPDGAIRIDTRSRLSRRPPGDLLQTGPQLLRHGEIPFGPDDDPEGISAAWHNPETRQLDDDWVRVLPRAPRSAIGLSDKHIWSAVCDGDTRRNRGLSLFELAAQMQDIGIQDALNLDGGGSASQYSNNELRNMPFGYEMYHPLGRPIRSAFVYEQIPVS
jgi:hypothetical protein